MTPFLMLVLSCVPIFNNTCCYQSSSKVIECLPPPNVHEWPPVPPKNDEIQAVSANLGVNCFNNLTWNKENMSPLIHLRYIIFDPK